jgi:eukaryotic-like serine/threonine-protein kinase
MEKYCPRCEKKYDRQQRFCSNDGELLSVTDPYGLVGTTLDGKYRIDAMVGIGGFGAVYSAHHKGLDKQVAFKILKPNVALETPETVKLFEKEAKTMARLKHDNIVTIHDAGRAADRFSYIAMEWLEGRTLREELGELRRLSFERTAEILRQVAAALAFAHASHNRTVHRDLKPDNVMLVEEPDGSKRVKVVDFGIAKVLSSTEGSMVSRVMGTPYYEAPEQSKRESPINGSADIYALGVMLYEMLTGSLPFSGLDREELIRLKLNGAPPPLREFLPDAPDAVDELLRTMMMVDPNQRPRIGDISDKFEAAYKTSVDASQAAKVAVPDETEVDPKKTGVEQSSQVQRQEPVEAGEAHQQETVLNQNEVVPPDSPFISSTSVDQKIDLPIQGRLPDSPLLGIDGLPFKQTPASVEQRGNLANVKPARAEEPPLKVKRPNRLTVIIPGVIVLFIVIALFAWMFLRDKNALIVWNKPITISNGLLEVALDRDGRMFASTDKGNEIRLFRVSDAEPIKKLSGPERQSRFVTFSPDNRFIASGNDDNNVWVWEVDGEKPPRKLVGHGDFIFIVQFSSDGQQVVSADWKGKVLLQQVSDGKLLGEITKSKQEERIVSICPTRRLVAFWNSNEGIVRIRSIVENKFLTTLRGHQSPVLCGAFDIDGRVLAIGSEDGVVRIWQVNDGQLLYTLNKSSSGVSSLLFNPTKLVIAIARNDGSIELYKPANSSWRGMELVKPLAGHTKPVQTMAFSGNGQVLATGSDDGTIQLWEIKE